MNDFSDPTDKISAEELAARFHAAYEELAHSFQYETRKESAVAWSRVPEADRDALAAANEILADIERRAKGETADAFLAAVPGGHGDPLGELGLTSPWTPQELMLAVEQRAELRGVTWADEECTCEEVKSDPHCPVKKRIEESASKSTKGGAPD